VAVNTQSNLVVHVLFCLDVWTASIEMSYT